MLLVFRDVIELVIVFGSFMACFLLGGILVVVGYYGDREVRV